MLYKLENIVKNYNGRTVLEVDSLVIESGKIYTLLGPNGAGKTTLLKILAFLDRPSSGLLQFNDKTTTWDNKLFELRRQVVLLDQSPIMFSGSVGANVAFGLKIRGGGREERIERVRAALRMVGMERFIEYEARGLSGGETKRVALARALVLRPRVLLCDEPTANVDRENQEIILDILARSNKESQTSIIFSTHYLSQSNRLADATLILQNGQLVSGFQENVFRARVKETRNGMAVLRINGQQELALPMQMCMHVKDHLRLEVDAAQIQLYTDAPEENEEGLILTGSIQGMVKDGALVRIQVDAQMTLNVLITDSQYDKARLTLGQKLRLYIPYRSINVRPSSYE